MKYITFAAVLALTGCDSCGSSTTPVSTPPVEETTTSDDTAVESDVKTELTAGGVETVDQADAPVADVETDSTESTVSSQQ